MNNAGGASGEQVTATCTEENFCNVMATNFDSAYHLSHLAYLLFKASKTGNVIFISA